MKNSQKGFITLLIIIGVLLITACVGYYFAMQKTQTTPISDSVQKTLTTTNTPIPTSTTSIQPKPVIPTSPTAIKLIGTWQSTDDPKSSITFFSDGTYQDAYQDYQDTFPIGTWYVINSLQNTEYSSLPNGLYLKRSEADIGDQYFGIDIVDGKNLELTYLGRGNTNSYKKIK